MDGPDREAGSRRDEASRFLAEQWGLEFREAHTLSIDPAALKLIDAGDARRLGAFPLALEAGRPVFAIAEPTSERLEAVRAASREDATFVIVCASTLDALLSSKIFNAGANRQGDGRQATAPTAPPAPPLEAIPEPTAEDVAQAAYHTATEVIVEEPASAPPLPERRVAAPLPAARAPGQPLPSRGLDLTDSAGGAPIERRPARPILVAVGPHAPGEIPSERLGALLTQISAGATHLASQTDELMLVLEDNQRELKMARAQLEEARVETDKIRAELEALRAELGQSQTLNEAVTLRLRELVHALETAQPGGGWEAGATAAALEASTRIA